MDEKRIARFWRKVDVRGPNECWEWTGFRSGSGYGQFRAAFKGGVIAAHRASYIIAHGPIPEGLIIRHKCDNRPCVNPAHLEHGTNFDNVQDRVQRGRNGDTSGTRNGRAKITPEVVRQILAELAAGREQQDVAIQFGVCAATVSHIHNRRTWKHVTPSH